MSDFELTEEEKTSLANNDRIRAIKSIRNRTGCTLRDAAELTYKVLPRLTF